MHALYNFIGYFIYVLTAYVRIWWARNVGCVPHELQLQSECFELTAPPPPPMLNWIVLDLSGQCGFPD